MKLINLFFPQISLIHVMTIVTSGPQILGYKLYNWNSEICCNGKVHSVDENIDSSGGLRQCCGQNMMTKNTNGKKWPLCCDGKVHLLDDLTNTTFECCGKDIIDKNQFRCFKKVKQVRIPKEGNKLGFCEISENEWAFYDEKNQQCCDGNLFNYDKNKQCWGSEYVNPKIHFFCNQYDVIDGTSTPKAIPLEDRNINNTECCNFKLFDIQTQACLVNKVVKKYEEVIKHCCGYTYRYNWTSRNWEAEKNLNNFNDKDCDSLYIPHSEYLCHKNQLCIVSLGENICPSLSKPYKTGKQACCSTGIFDLSLKQIQNGTIDCCE